MKPEQITAWALDEASAEERERFETELREDPKAKHAADETKEFCHFLLAELRDESLALTEEQRDRLKAQPMGQSSHLPEATDAIAPRKAVPSTKWRAGLVRLALAACVVLGAFWTWQQSDERKYAQVAMESEPEHRVQFKRRDGEVIKAPPVEDDLLLEAKPLKVMDPLAGIADGKGLAVTPADHPPPQLPQMLTLNAGQSTMTTRDVEELKKIQDQTVYRLDYGRVSGGAPAGPMLAAAPSATGSVSSGGILVVGGTTDRASGDDFRFFAGKTVVVGNDVAGTPGLVGGWAGTGNGMPVPASKPMDGTALVDAQRSAATAGEVVALRVMQEQAAPQAEADVKVDTIRGEALNRGAGDVTVFSGVGSGGKMATGATLDLNGAAAMTHAGGGALTISGGSTLTIAGASARTSGTPQPGTVTFATRTLTGQGAPEVPASPPVVMNPEPAVLGKALAQQKGVNLMTAPVVTTKSGTVATSVVTRDLETSTAAAPTDAYYFAFNEGRESGRRKELDELQEQERVAGFRPLKDARSDTESYTRILENELKDVAREPLSTFSIDVDTAAYANVRRFLNQNTVPPADAVRIEELVNYFPTAEEGPAHDAKEPFAVRVEMAPCPWQPAHRLARIAIKGRELGDERKNSNLVFLVDVSGSMNEPNKLPLVQQSLRMLTEQLGEGDKVTMVVYAGSSGLVLPPTNGENKREILAAIDKLKAGGSTHGSAGIQLAYEQAVAGFIKEGVNRVILCTDGDFNVGVSSPEELEKLITRKAKSGVFLSVLGYGTGNLKDRTMETLADKGNGNYAYIDSLSEARKVLVEQMSGTLVTIAKDVKIQVEFNPAAVRSYRLIGYENRMLAKEDFNDDTKDAGEIGAGHSVVALYEVVPANLPPGAEPRPAVDSLKYQAPAISPAQLAEAAKSGETMTVKLRYKEPDGDQSKLIEMPVKDDGKTLTASSEEYKFSAAVAGFGLLLRDSAYKGALSWETVRRLAIDGKGADKLGYRGEFLQLIDKARGLKETQP
ncbi:MAG: von Willebrand factor type A domain-containing protein [Prosthecobacter sp.]